MFAGKRARVGEEMVATTFYHELLAYTLPEIKSDELTLNVTLQELARPTPIIDATALLMRQALSTSHLPPRKRFTKMNGDQHLYNEIMKYVEDEQLGLSPQNIDCGKEFLSHITATFSP